MTISTAERHFFIELGERIANLRKTRNITQVQLAEVLGVSQQTIQAHEVGRRRTPVSALPAVGWGCVNTDCRRSAAASEGAGAIAHPVHLTGLRFPPN
jgi:DNA-binding XRE family transcriptional regulator